MGFFFGKDYEFILDRFNYIFLWMVALNVQIFLKLMSYIWQRSDIKREKLWDLKYFKCAIIYIYIYW